MLKKLVAFMFIIIILFAFIAYPLLFVEPEEGGRLSVYGEDANPNDLSIMRKSIEEQEDYRVGTIISNILVLNTVGDVEGKLFVKIGFGRNLSVREKDALSRFLDDGGRAIIADDSGYANSISEDYGVRFYGSTIWDEGSLDETSPDISFPIAQVFDRSIDPEQIYSVMLNNPTGMVMDEDVSKGYIASNTSDDTYIDFNGNNKIDKLGDKSQSMPTMIRVKTSGGGIIYFISDPGLFTNQIYDKHDNKEFTLELIHYLLPDGGHIIFEETGQGSNQFLYSISKSINMVGGIASMDISDAKTVLLIAFFCFLVVGLSSMVRSKKIWIHKFDLTTYRGAKKPAAKDHIKILHSLVVGKIAIKAMLSQEEAKDMDPEDLVKHVEDEELQEFLRGPDPNLKKEELIHILGKIKAMKK